MVYEYTGTLPNDDYKTLAQLAVFVCGQGNYTSMKVENTYYSLSSNGIIGETSQDDSQIKDAPNQTSV